MNSSFSCLLTSVTTGYRFLNLLLVWLILTYRLSVFNVTAHSSNVFHFMTNTAVKNIIRIVKKLEIDACKTKAWLKFSGSTCLSTSDLDQSVNDLWSTTKNLHFFKSDINTEAWNKTLEPCVDVTYLRNIFKYWLQHSVLLCNCPACSPALPCTI